MTRSWGSKYVALVFSFIIHTDHRHFVGTGIRGLDPPRKPRKLESHENKTTHIMCPCGIITNYQDARNGLPRLLTLNGFRYSWYKIP